MGVNSLLVSETMSSNVRSFSSINTPWRRFL